MRMATTRMSVMYSFMPFGCNYFAPSTSHILILNILSKGRSRSAGSSLTQAQGIHWLLLFVRMPISIFMQIAIMMLYVKSLKLTAKCCKPCWGH